MEIDSPENMMRHIRFLKSEVERLKKNLRTSELQRESPNLWINGDIYYPNSTSSEWTYVKRPLDGVMDSLVNLLHSWHNLPADKILS